MNSHSETGLGECLTDQLMADYLDGALTPVIKAACEVHLIACDQCREKLAAFMRVLQPDISPGEHDAVEKAVAQWERRDPRPTPRHAGRSRKRALLYGAIAALIVVVVLVRGLLLQGPDDLVLAVLENYRPFEAQMDRQPYNEPNATRGPDNAPNLGILSEELLKRSPDDYELGRWALLGKDYDKAIQFLTAATAEPKVLNDLGVAYLNRNGSGDLELARQKLEAALRLDDTYRPAIFNLCLLYELQGLTADADRERTRYLKLDQESGWAKELRNRRLLQQDR